MGTTATFGLPYPEGSDQPQVHLDIKAALEEVDLKLPLLISSGVLVGTVPPAGTRLTVQTKTPPAAVTTSAGGDITITFPQAFPNGLCSAHVTNMSGNSVGAWFSCHTATLTQVVARLWTGSSSGAVAVPSTSVVYSLTAVGW